MPVHAENSSPHLAEIVAELSRREPIFHRPEHGVSRKDFEAMIAPDFWEVGASGRCYSRSEVLDVLETRFAGAHDDQWKTSDFHCRQLGPDVYLLTYQLMQDGKRKTRRCTIWQRGGAGWIILYHQGTLIQEP